MIFLLLLDETFFVFFILADFHGLPPPFPPKNLYLSVIPPPLVRPRSSSPERFVFPSLTQEEQHQLVLASSTVAWLRERIAPYEGEKIRQAAFDYYFLCRL